MKIIKKMLPVDRYGYYDDSELAENYIEYLEKQGIEEIRYFYGTGSYEGTGSYDGTGQILALKEGKWYLQSMGHCSCYGPLDDGIILNGGYDSFESVLINCTEDLRKDVEVLIVD